MLYAVLKNILCSPSILNDFDEMHKNKQPASASAEAAR
jgi:hypothetical protein